MVMPRAVNVEIIQKNLHKSQYILTKDFGGNKLEGWRRRFLSKHHDDCDEDATLRHERRFVLVIRVHAKLVRIGGIVISVA